MIRSIFADPKNDVAFRKLFGDKKHEDILIDFLNDILERPLVKKIESVSITDPFNLPLALGLKTSIVDVRCYDDHNRHYQIEMQVSRQKDYAERCQYYTSFFVAKQLEKKKMYQTLEPIIFISIVNFKLFAAKHHLSHHVVMDTQTHEQSLHLFEYHFLELSKFKKKEDELKTPVDRWAYFFKHADDCAEVPKSMEKDETMMDAFDVLKQAVWNREDLENYWRAVDAEISNRSILETAQEDGEARGEVRGEARGIEKGKAEVARQMLAEGCAVALIQKVTGMSAEEIAKLK